ncbi:hypothetical protein [Teichococcus deserti]|uniref:hypothetical protein n=1 Tax=Teichococcus deserti TaxID=1817963 RepID=UPI0013F5B464|nr:hypothetical protein [Pseudoroseomonas deserti]
MTDHRPSQHKASGELADVDLHDVAAGDHAQLADQLAQLIQGHVDILNAIYDSILHQPA